MTNFSEPLSIPMGRFLFALACLLACLPSLAQETAPATPLSADEIIERMLEKGVIRREVTENRGILLSRVG